MVGLSEMARQQREEDEINGDNGFQRHETPQEILERIARNEQKLDKIYTEFNVNLQSILRVLLFKALFVIFSFLLNGFIVYKLANINESLR
jgi:hypothetical protein